MDNVKFGTLIKSLRKENKLTQLQLADKLKISDKTVSKWERGLGFPDISLVIELSKIFSVDTESLLSGELGSSKMKSINVKKIKFYVCPYCGNLITSFNEVSAVCCGRIMIEAKPKKASDDEKLKVEIIENDYFITTSHEMKREHYISFLSFVNTDTLIVKKLYPEWNLEARIPRISEGRILFYCSVHGLFYQEL